MTVKRHSTHIAIKHMYILFLSDLCAWKNVSSQLSTLYMSVTRETTA